MHAQQLNSRQLESILTRPAVTECLFSALSGLDPTRVSTYEASKRTLVAAVGDPQSNVRNPWTLRYLGHRLINLGEYQEAVKVLTEAERLFRPSRTIDDLRDVRLSDDKSKLERHLCDNLGQNIQWHLGVAHFLAGSYQTALGHFYNASMLAPNDEGKAMAHGWSYLCQSMLGQEGVALLELSRVCAQNLALTTPGYTAYAEALKIILGDKATFAKTAQTVFDQAVRDTPNDVQVAILGSTLGIALRARRKVREGQAMLAETARVGLPVAFGTLVAKSQS